ncbi:MAG: LysE family translocator [Caldilineaceae bacterium]
MAINFLPLLSYVFICTFTPGPSNITSTSLALLHGYRNTLWYQGGLAVGVFIFMWLTGLVSAALLQLFPVLEPFLRYVGAAYILYLAYHVARATYVFADQEGGKPLGFTHGFLLQILNPKLFFYALTLFATFLAPITGNMIWLTLAAFLLAAVSFGATSVWALFGTTIKRYLHVPRLQFVINLILALSLLYAALALIELV